jgi:uncharacterized membrane protein YhaH (DUF805 family)
MPLMFQPFVKYADFDGRARRSEYWLFSLFNWIVLFGAVIVSAVLRIGSEPGQVSPGAMTISLLLLLYYLAAFIPGLAVAVRRLHDSDKSGFWLFLAFLPVVGGLVIFIFTLLDGTEGDNRYGPDPKGRASRSYGPGPVQEVHHYHHEAGPIVPPANPPSEGA